MKGLREYIKKKLSPNWGLIIPHRKNSGGARGTNPFGIEMSEYQFAEIEALYSELPYEYRDDSNSYFASMELVKSDNINAVIEIHKNAFDENVKGFQICVLHGDTRSYDAAESIAKKFKKRYPERIIRYQDGVCELNISDRGYNNLREIKASGVKIALLSEMFFIDSPDDWMNPTECGDFWRDILG